MVAAFGFYKQIQLGCPKNNGTRINYVFALLKLKSGH